MKKLHRWQIFSALIVAVAIALALSNTVLHPGRTHAAGKPPMNGQLIEFSCAQPITSASVTGSNQNGQWVTWPWSGFTWNQTTNGWYWKGKVYIQYHGWFSSQGYWITVPTSGSGVVKIFC